MSASNYDVHYREGGFGYEERRDFWRAWVAEKYVRRFDIPPGATLLDAGCGDGFWSSVFHELGFRVSGFDLSEGGVEVARERYPGPAFEVGDLDGELPFGDQRFRVVFTRNLSHYCARIDESRAVAATARLLSLTQDDGLLLISQFSRRDGSQAGSTVSYPVSAYAATFEQVAEIWRFSQAANHLMFGLVRHGARALSSG